MSQEPEDTLTEAYRRASEADAGRPGAAVRNAILAEAAAAAAASARRRAPAANDSRYWPRMVAGIAVVGLGVLLWRQTDHRMPGEPAVVVAPTFAPAPAPAEERSADTGRADTQLAAPSTAAPSPATQPAPPDPIPEAPPPAAPPPSVVARASPPPPVQREPDDEELAEVPVAGARIQTPNSVREEAAGVDRAALLRQHFPAQYQSDAPHSLWLVQNAAGEVVQSGELAPGQRPEDLAPQIARALGGVPGPWQAGTVRNARGQPITLAIARLP